jgi:hypothetical protein
MRAKHEHLETDKLVLVSEAGFTRQARELAEHFNIATLAPVDLGGDDPQGEVVNRLRSLWPKAVSLTARPGKSDRPQTRRVNRVV